MPREKNAPFAYITVRGFARTHRVLWPGVQLSQELQVHDKFCERMVDTPQQQGEQQTKVGLRSEAETARETQGLSSTGAATTDHEEGFPAVLKQWGSGLEGRPSQKEPQQAFVGD